MIGWLTRALDKSAERRSQTPGGIPLSLMVAPFGGGAATSDPAALRLPVEHARLRLLRGFEELLCLEGLTGVEHFPHQIETARRVLRHFHGRVLLADEVGLGKTIEACLLLREYLLRGLVRRALILVPAALVPQWEEELAAKFHLEFAVATNPDAEFWKTTDRVLASLSLAKSRRNFEAVTAHPWDLVIVDEAHHCKSRQTRNWQLVNAIQRRYLFLLTATPVQNDLLELYNLLTLLAPGHLKTEADFKKHYMRRGNPRDPRNRERLRTLLGEVMVRNTRSLVSLDLPPRYAHTILVAPDQAEAHLYGLLDTYLRWRRPSRPAAAPETEQPGPEPLFETPPAAGDDGANGESAALNRMQINTLLLAAGSHPAALLPVLERTAAADPRAGPLLDLARGAGVSAKEKRLLQLLEDNRRDKTLVFANFTATLERLQAVLREAGIPFSLFSGAQTARQKAEAVAQLRDRVPVMLCSESGGEGQNLQFCNTLVNFDLPWNPMRIEQRVGRIHRIGQKREVFIFNLCRPGSLEARVLGLLSDKIRMFELVVGEVGSILGNLEGGDEFETLVLNMWIRSRDEAELGREFEQLGESLLKAQEDYLKAKELDDALFGEDFQ
jgi:SNF2 family DNA or RNA helicase